MKDLRDQKNSKMQDSVNEVRQVYRERMKQQRTDMENNAARAKQRTAIARSGYEKVRQFHTYEKRIQSMIMEIGKRL